MPEQTFDPTAREEALLCRTAHPDEIEELRGENERLRERLETLEFKFNELIDVLKNNGVASELLVFTKVKETTT